MNNFITAMLLSILSLLSKLSWKTLYSLSDAASWVMFDVFGYRKKIIWRNLRNSFPTKSDETLLPIARSFYKHFTDLVVETVKLQHITPDEIHSRITGNTKLIEDLYRENKSAVFVLGHRGNWEIANLFASLSFPHECIVVYKPLSNPSFEKWFNALRSQFGNKLVPMKEVYRYLDQPHDKPYLLFLVNDQSPNPLRAYWTKFLNQDTGVFRGVELISRAHNLPVIYGDIARKKAERGTYELKLEMLAPEPNQLPNNAILQKQIQFLERDILDDPGNWLWSHKRWKHPRPAHLDPEQLLSKPDYDFIESQKRSDNPQ